MVDQPGAQRGQQLATDIFAQFETLLVIGDLSRKQLVNFLVGRQEGVAGLFHQLFFECEVRQGVVHQLFQYRAHIIAPSVSDSVVQLIDLPDDSSMLIIDDRNLRIQFRIPCKISHCSSRLRNPYQVRRALLQGRA
jgi:hypothetical protein